MIARRLRLLLLPVLLLAACVPALGFAADTPPATSPEKLPTTPAKLRPVRKGEAPRFEIVLIHGLGGAAAEWDQVEPYLKNTFRVFHFELAGHGKTQPVMDPTIASEAKRLDAFIRENGIANPSLVGHGMGGMIAMQYALDHPDDVFRLILIDAAPKQLATAEEKAQIGRQLIESYDQFVGQRYSAMSPNDATSKRILDMALKTHAPSLVSLLMSSFDFDLTGRLRSLKVPMLVVGSEMMLPKPDDAQQVLAAMGYDKARSLSFKRFAGTGHYIMLEQPVVLASVLMAFGVSADYEFEP
jgi:pimeloyl-ACP methyl ester carboxylesterase